MGFPGGIVDFASYHFFAEMRKCAIAMAFLNKWVGSLKHMNSFIFI